MGIVYKTCGCGEFDTAYSCDPCPDGEGGRVRSLVLIKKGTVITFPLEKLEWEIQVGLGNIIIMPETRGTFDGGTPRGIPGYGSVQEIKVGDDYVLTVSDPQYVDNAGFWEEAERHTWNVAYLSEKSLHYVAQDVMLTAKAPIEEDMNVAVDWDIELKWFSRIKPVVANFATIAALFKKDGSGFVNEIITGLSLASGTVTPQVVYLQVDVDKTCYVILPDGSMVTSTADVINTTWAGAAGAVTLIVPKNNALVGLNDGGHEPYSNFIGELYLNALSVVDISGCSSITLLSSSALSVYAPGCTSLTSISAPNATFIFAAGCTLLTSLSAPNATNIDASGCALTANSIAAFFAELVATGKLNGALDISGGTSAGLAELSAQAVDDLAILAMAVEFGGQNWVVSINAVPI